jgi:PAS domain S-box-containing protein
MRSLGIGKRLIIFCGALYLAFAFLFTVGEALAARAAIRRKITAEIASLTETNAPIMVQAYWNLDTAEIDLILRALVAHSSVARAELVDKRGRTVAGVDAPEERTDAGPNALPARRYPLIHGTQGKGEIELGSLIIYPSLVYARRQVLETVAMGIGRTLGIVVLLAAILAFAVERFLGGPLREFARRISTLNAGEPGRDIMEPPPNASGELVLATLAFNKMSARVGATVDALRESERRFRSFFEDSPISLWEEDFSEVRKRVDEARPLAEAGDWAAYFSKSERVAELVPLVRVLDVNRATLELLGYGEKAEALKSLPYTLSEEALSTWRSEFIALASGLTGYAGESVYRDAAGRRISIQLKMSVVPGFEKDWSRVLVSIMDLSERKRAEEALKASEAKYRSLVEQSSEGIVLLDPQGTIVECNGLLERMVGLGKEAILGRKVWDIEHGRPRGEAPADEDPARIRSTWSRLIESGGADFYAKPFEVAFRRADGSERVIEQTAFPISMGSGLMIGGVLRDVTEKREAARALVDSLREKELLLKEVHHRVKNNLQVICSLINLQIYEVDGESPTGRSLVDMEARVRSMSLVHELLYQSGDFAVVDFSSYVNQLCDHLIAAYLADPGRVALRLAIRDISLALDKAIPCGLLINELVVNALKHAFPNERSGSIEVAMRREPDGRMRLTVKDDGVGAPKPKPGSGARTTLGMSLVNSLAAQLGGECETESVAGMRISVIFPV